MVPEFLRHVSILALFGMLVAVGVVAGALAYAIKPQEQRLALMRPLSLAAIFGGLTSFTVGVVNVLQGLSATAAAGSPWRGVAAGVAESFVGLLVAFGCLTLAWLLVALGLRRT